MMINEGTNENDAYNQMYTNDILQRISGECDWLRDKVTECYEEGYILIGYKGTSVDFAESFRDAILRHILGQQ